MLSPPRPTDEEELHFKAFNCHMQIATKQRCSSRKVTRCDVMWDNIRIVLLIGASCEMRKGCSIQIRSQYQLHQLTRFWWRLQAITAVPVLKSGKICLMVDNGGENVFMKRILNPCWFYEYANL